MKRILPFVVLAISLAALLGGAGGCSKKATSSGTVSSPVSELPPEERQPVETPGERPGEPAPERSPLELQDVFFDLDKYNLKADAQASLAENARMLEEHPEARILIEGHCDERGTSEYNLALGDHRARTARDYLLRYGISAMRIETVSYGEERPFVTGHSEAAWVLNRRAHFVIQD